MRRIMKTILLLLILAVSGVVRAVPTKVMADSAYQEGKYQAAATMYEELLRVAPHADVYYNLANCYYKSDSLALAILNYERSRLLEPGREDVKHNLELAYNKTIDKITPQSEMFFIGWWRDFVDLLPMDSWAVCGVVCFWLLCLLVLVYMFSSRIWLRKTGFYLGIFMLIGLLLANLSASAQRKKLQQRDKAIVMCSAITIKSTPNASGTDLFVLHEGSKVTILDTTMKDWCEIRIADGKTGWMPVRAMEVI